MGAGPVLGPGYVSVGYPGDASLAPARPRHPPHAAGGRTGLRSAACPRSRSGTSTACPAGAGRPAAPRPRRGARPPATPPHPAARHGPRKRALGCESSDRWANPAAQGCVRRSGTGHTQAAGGDTRLGAVTLGQLGAVLCCAVM